MVWQRPEKSVTRMCLYGIIYESNRFLFDWDLVDREVNRTYREPIITNTRRWSWPQERWVELIRRLIKEWMWLLWRQEGRPRSGRLAHAQNRLVKSQELWGNRWLWCKQTARVNYESCDLQLVVDHDLLWYYTRLLGCNKRYSHLFLNKILRTCFSELPFDDLSWCVCSFPADVCRKYTVIL